MAKLLRYFQKVFGINAGANQMSEYGSLVGDPPGNLYSGATINPDIIQNLSQFESGQFAAMGGAYSPLLQDHNSLFYLFSRQLAYLFQSGIAEWDDETTYYIGSYAQVAGVAYISLVDNNLNNAVSDNTKWRLLNAPPLFTRLSSSSGTYTTSTTLTPLYLRIQLVGGGGAGAGSTDTLPNPAGGDAGDTWFGSSSTIFGGGGKGGAGPDVGEGGDTVVGMGALSVTQIKGGTGGQTMYGSLIALNYLGGNGGSTPYGCAFGYETTGDLPIPESGIGGAGAGGTNVTPPHDFFPGPGGGGGGFVEAYILNPGKGTTFNYEVGAGGTAGTAGSGGHAGANGASGGIGVWEYYQ